MIKSNQTNNLHCTLYVQYDLCMLFVQPVYRHHNRKTCYLFIIFVLFLSIWSFIWGLNSVRFMFILCQTCWDVLGQFYFILLFIQIHSFCLSSSGVHTYQVMYGCEWDDKIGTTNGFRQEGFDGEDFLSLDLKELRWISPVQQGIPTVQNLNNDRSDLEYDKIYYNTECIEWLQKYLQYGKSSLEKTGTSVLIQH